SPVTPGFQRNLLSVDRCRLVSDAHVPPGPANIFAMRSASASCARTRAADRFASTGQSTFAVDAIGDDSPAGAATAGAAAFASARGAGRATGLTAGLLSTAG